MREDTFYENLGDIGQSLTAYYADLENIAVADSEMFFHSMWITGDCKYCSGIKRVAIPIHTTFIDFRTGDSLELH